jgi:hypothetical protein
MRFRFCGDLDCPDWVLAEVSTLSKLSSIRMKVLVGQIITYCIEKNFSYEKILKLAADNGQEGVNDLKGAVAAVHFIVMNAAKFDLDEQSLVQEIQQLGLPKENSDALGRQFRENKDSMRATLSEESFRINRLLSTEFRVDHIIASSSSSSSASASASSSATAPAAVSGTVINLKFVYDNRPQDTTDRQIKEFACELSQDKFDLLVKEVSHAIQLIESIEN